ncbi:PAS domain-containing protein [Sinorhizobium sp. BG8]|uniref:PAS domain-containing protein n=1 Tax=Sinorhizobium sp. BG8 TaxID=2613773 RepID=UPI00193DE194|nr:PAS domain-containing protein [Sinorhizobium sp. BG8]QRM55977.1 PAS domain-containing protein [Sinorhizobium sp. BG8]
MDIFEGRGNSRDEESPTNATERLTATFWKRYNQLREAVRSTDDLLVGRLDREVTTALSALLNHRAATSKERQVQFGALLRLLREEADDSSCVMNNATRIENLLRRYLPQDEKADSFPPLPSLASTVNDGLLDVPMMDNLPERVSIVTTDYRYLYTNAVDASRLGRKPHELVGRHVSEVLGADQFEASVKSDLDRCFGGETVEETTVRQGDGGTIVVRRRLTPCYADKNILLGALVVTQEGPDRRKRTNA